MEYNDDIKLVVDNIEEEVSVLKTLLEKGYQEGYAYSPMVVFYKDPKTKTIVVSPSDNDTFAGRMYAISEILHLHTAMYSWSSVVSFTSTVEVDGEEKSALNIFVMCELSAYIITLPFIAEGSNVTWFPELDSLHTSETIELDESGRDLLTMFNIYIRLIKSPFTAPEILSYLSSKNMAISQLDSIKVPYFDMSDEGEVKV